MHAFRRRFWYVVLPFFLICLTVILYCIRAPRVYKAKTVILVEPQQMPKQYVSPTVTIDLRSRLRTITQQIKSRTRLEKIIEEYDLYAGTLASGTLSDAVTAFSKNIEVNVQGRGEAFEVSFQGRNPAKVRDVTNKLADLFIEDNLRLREAQAQGTTSFLDRELKRVQETLQQKEKALRDFKEKNGGFLPEDTDRNYNMMSHSQQTLDSINTNIQQITDRRILLETQLNNLRRMQAGRVTPGMPGSDLTGAGEGSTYPRPVPSLSELREQLKDLKSRYSDKHPDVIRMQASIAKREEEKRAAHETGADGSQGTQADTGSDTEDASLLSAQIQELSAQVSTADRELEELRRKRATVENDLRSYQQRIEGAPRVEQMLIDLTRDYDDIQENYRSLLEKKFSAQLAENLEVSQKGEQFTVLDRAQLPDRPFKPQTAKLLKLGFLLALAGGLGLAFLLEYLDQAYFATKDLEGSIQLPVLASIPVILTKRDHQRFLMRRAASAAALFSMSLVLVYAFYVLWKMDPSALPIPI